MSDVLIVPDEIAELARRARSSWIGGGLNPDSPSLCRTVLADWLEEQGEREYMVRFLRERPLGHDEAQWLRDRNWVLNAVIEAHEKRDALLELKRRREAQ